MNISRNDSATTKRILTIVGDFTEDYEIYVVFQVLQAFGYEVDAVCPGKKVGDICRTAVHDFLPGFQTYCESRGHNFPINEDFDNALTKLHDYSGLYIPGGRSPEYLSLDPKVKDVVKFFFEKKKVVASICHGQQILAASGVLKNRKTTGYPAIRSQCELAGATWISPEPISIVHTESNYISGAAWPGHPELISQFTGAMNCKITHRGGSKKILCLAGDFMEDLEIMVPYQGLLAMGHSVDVVCPNRKEGEMCSTAIHDFEGDQTYTEKPGHRFELNADFSAAVNNVSSYDALLIPGGRAPEYLCCEAAVLDIVKHFFHANKPVASICHGQIILAAAGVIDSRKCTCYPAVQPIIESAGAEYLEPNPISMCVTDGNLVTGAAWPGHPEFLRQFALLLETDIAP